MRRSALLLLALAAPAAAQEAGLEIVNATGLTVMELYAAPLDGPWSGDILGSAMIEAGGTGRVALPAAGPTAGPTAGPGAGGCEWRLRAVLEDGGEVAGRVDACREGSHRLSR